MRKISVITGATSGIGFEMSKIIAKEDTDLLLISNDETMLEKTKKELEKISRNKIEYIMIDLSKNVSTWSKILEDKLKGHELLYMINNAGFGDFGEFSECDIEKQNDMINLNILALTNISKIYFNATKAKTSYLLNVASVAAYMSGPLMSVYYATKAYVLSFTRALAYENRNNKGIKISALCPGPTNTSFVKSSSLENSGLFYNLKVMSAEDVANLAITNLKKGKMEIICGWKNKFMIILNKFSPKCLVEYVVYLIMRNKK